MGAGTSKANTAIWHTGFDAKPGTREAELVARGHRLLSERAEEMNWPLERTGALLVAWDDEQLGRLDSIVANAEQVGYHAVERMSVDAVYAAEPHLGAGVTGGLRVPDEGLLDPWSIVIGLATDAVVNGADPAHVGARDRGRGARRDVSRDGRRTPRRGRLDRERGRAAQRRGRPADGRGRIHRDAAAWPAHRVRQAVPWTARAHHPSGAHGHDQGRAGVAHRLRQHPAGAHGRGPARQGRQPDDACRTRRTARDGRTGSCRPLLDEEVTATYAGLRAATEHSDYCLAVFAPKRYVRMGGIRSTGISSCLSLAEDVTRQLAEHVAPPQPLAHPTVVATPTLAEARLRPYADAALIAADPAYGHVVCLCERVTRGEIRDALAGPVPATDLDGIRRRTRALAGRCQGFHCGATVTAMLDEGGRACLTSSSSGPARPGSRSRATSAASGVGDVVVLDRDDEPGGVPRHSHHPGYGLRDLHRSLSGPAYARRLADAAASAGADVRTRATVTGLHAGEGALTVDVTSPDGRTSLAARAVVLATGCRERPRSARLVPGSRPAGVLTTGWLQRAVYGAGQPVGTRAVVVGAEHVSYSAVMTLAHAGCRTVAMVTDKPTHTSYAAFDLGARTRYRFPLLTRTSVTDIIGRDRVRAVEVTDHATGERSVIECDTVVFTGDWIAENELPRRLGVAMNAATTGPVVDGRFRTSRAGVFAIGNLLHPASTADRCALDGRSAAGAVAAWTSADPAALADARRRHHRGRGRSLGGAVDDHRGRVRRRAAPRGGPSASPARGSSSRRASGSCGPAGSPGRCPPGPSRSPATGGRRWIPTAPRCASRSPEVPPHRA